MAYTTIDDPSAHFQTMAYTGNASVRSLTNDGNSDLQPDLVWIKKRSATGNHQAYDSTRGVTAGIYPHLDNVEETLSNRVTSFDSDGFSTANEDANNDGATYVAWQWKANGGTTASLSAGDITATSQVNTTAGFNILTYTGSGTIDDTIEHALGAVPDVMIFKSVSGSDEAWIVWHSAIGDNGYLILNTTAAKGSAATWFLNDTAPTSTRITLGNGGTTNDASLSPPNTYICYAWTEIQGYSKFGGYTGNGNADGPFIYTGFKPAWIMIKNLASGESWEMWDNARDPHNVLKKRLKADTNGAEHATGTFMDFVSNGVKHRNYSGGHNNNGESYIYMAFAENPFVTSGGVPCTAR